MNKLRDNFNNPQAQADSDAWIRMLISLYLFANRSPAAENPALRSSGSAPPPAREPRGTAESTIIYEGLYTPAGAFNENAKDLTFKIPASPHATPASRMSAFMSASLPAMAHGAVPSFTFKLPEAPASMQGRRIHTGGDSIGRGFSLFLQSRGIDVENSGIDGAGLLGSNKIANITGVKNSAVIMSCGTNDVAGLIGKSDKELGDYATEVVARCVKLQDAGNLVFLLSVNPPKNGEYTGGGAWWKNETNQKNWAETSERLNKAYETAIAAANAANPGHPAIKSLDISGVSQLRAGDNLHYGAKAYETMLAGLTGNRPIGA